MENDILQRFEQIIDDVEQLTVLELGACDGYHSDQLVKRIKNCMVPFVFHCFEPNAELHIQILDKLKGHLMFNNGIISVFPHAIGSEIKEAIFYKSYGHKVVKGKVVDNYYGSSSIMKPTRIFKDYPDMKFEESKVIVSTLDHHAKYRLPNRKIDFIWSDIQGAEADMIKGGRETLKRTRYLYTEYNNGEHYEGQVLGIESLLKLLPDFKLIEDYGGDALLKNIKI